MKNCGKDAEIAAEVAMRLKSAKANAQSEQPQSTPAEREDIILILNHHFLRILRGYGKYVIAYVGAWGSVFLGPDYIEQFIARHVPAQGMSRVRETLDAYRQICANPFMRAVWVGILLAPVACLGLLTLAIWRAF